ncbi:MAG: NAD(P)-binding domain-containing protein [Alphaproteobacteria bacterium]|nr:NAD(P)-binding domain-containing protein [Alphaproteobacteria bacterium]
MPATLGFIGTGNITAALVTGLCGSDRPPERVIVGPRNAETAARLAARHRQVSVATDNQAVIDASDWIILAVRPQIAREVVRALRFKPGQAVLSLIAPIADEWLDAAVGPGRLVARFLVMPPIEFRLGAIVYYPRNPEVERLLAPAGTPLAVRNKHEFLTTWTITATIASNFNLIATAADWAARNGVAAETARAFAVSMFHAVAAVAAMPGAAPPPELAKLAQTKGGLNEQVLRELSDRGWFDQVSAALDAVLKRLEGR